jgi:hypothetical protein
MESNGIFLKMKSFRKICNLFHISNYGQSLNWLLDTLSKTPKTGHENPMKTAKKKTKHGKQFQF